MGFFSRLDPVAYLVRRNRRRLRERAGLTEKTVHLENGLDVAYLDDGVAGDTRETLVLVHGIGANKDHWPRVAHYLGGRFRILAPDLPGFGDSSRPGAEGEPPLRGDDLADTYGTEVQADHVRQFAEALRLGRFHLAGNSMGGRIAALYAAAHPETLHSLWLLAPSGATEPERSDLARLMMRGERVPLFSRTAAEYAEMLDFAMEQPPDLSRFVYRALAAESAPYHELNRRIFAVLSAEGRTEPPTEEVLRGVSVPTLLTWGTEDRVLDPSAAAGMAEALAGPVTVRRMENIGHIPMLENPEAIAQDYLAFQDEQEETAAAAS